MENQNVTLEKMMKEKETQVKKDFRKFLDGMSDKSKMEYETLFSEALEYLKPFDGKRISHEQHLIISAKIKDFHPALGMDYAITNEGTLNTMEYYYTLDMKQKCIVRYEVEGGL